MRKRLILLLLGLGAFAQEDTPRPETLIQGLLAGDGLEPGVLSVRDRELLRGREQTRHLFPENEPHLLPSVRQALDDPLGIPGRARDAFLRVQRVNGPWMTESVLDPFAWRGFRTAEAGAGPPPPDLAWPEFDEATRKAVDRLYRAASGAAEILERELGKLPADERAHLEKTLPLWITRMTPEEKERIVRGEEDALGREALERCAASWAKVDAGLLLAAWWRLLTETAEVLPVLRQQPRFVDPVALASPRGQVLLRGHRSDDGFVDDCLLVIDFGGDDHFKLAEGAARLSVRVVIDLEGNDLYLSRASFAWGAALLGMSLLVDAGGDDDYRGGDWSLGCGVGGHGALWDLGGRDRYYAGLGAQGAGIFGTGLLLDDGGDDEYAAGCFCQGFGSTGGWGALVDRQGADTYTAGRDEPDAWRREGTFVTFAQGAAFGHRFGHVRTDDKGARRWQTTGQIPAGVGVLFDCGGDDRYEADVFGQGTAYWYGLGLLVDGGGNDRYRATWYGQGVGTHAAAGAVVDLGGDDWYFSRNTSQGCGHDFSVGILHDLGGNDTYVGLTLCQGAGNALSALGLLVDEGGDDRYRCGGRAWGIAPPEADRPDASPFGFLLDLAGDDRFEGGALEAVDPAGKFRQGERGYGWDR